MLPHPSQIIGGGAGGGLVPLFPSPLPTPMKVEQFGFTMQ